MGNKCCSKRQEPDIGCPGGKKKDFGSSMSQPNGSLDSRYTPDPNRVNLKGVGVDFIRPRQPTRKCLFVINFHKN